MHSNIVFDLDGTLITCENKQKFVLYSLLNLRSELSRDQLNYWWELKREGLNTEQALNKLGIRDSEIIAKEWSRTIENFTWCFLDKPFSDSLPVLKSLKLNYRLSTFILTARNNYLQALQIVRIYGLDDFIDDLIVVKQKDVVNGKSNHLARLNPLMYIGDTEIDHVVAQNSKTRFVALSRGQRTGEFLKKLGVKQIEKDFKFLENDGSIFQFRK